MKARFNCRRLLFFPECLLHIIGQIYNLVPEKCKVLFAWEMISSARQPTQSMHFAHVLFCSHEPRIEMKESTKVVMSRLELPLLYVSNGPCLRREFDLPCVKKRLE
jgi:hypothetical protein